MVLHSGFHLFWTAIKGKIMVLTCNYVPYSFPWFVVGNYFAGKKCQIHMVLPARLCP